MSILIENHETAKIYKNLDLLSNVDLQNKMENTLDFDALHMFGVQYFSLGFRMHDTGKSKSIAADNTWLKFIETDDFMSQYFLKIDKIWNAIYQFLLTCNKDNPGKQQILLYSSFDFSEKFDQEIVVRRRKHKLKKGVMLLTNYEKYFTCLTFASNSRYFSEIDFVIKQQKIIELLQSQSVHGINNLYLG